MVIRRLAITNNHPAMHPKHLLERHGLVAKKSLGQNFLYDEAVLARIAAAADLAAGDEALEIGPGLGALTRHLAQTAGRVIAVELDDRLLPILEEQLAGYPNVTLVHGDILEIDPAAYFTGPYKVVANVPYYITGAILRHLLAGRHKPTLMVLTVQQEVAERLSAGPGDMSLLAASVQFYGQVSVVDGIKAGAFWPRPEVDSAVVRIDLAGRPAVDVADEEGFFRVVKAGFSQKRKQLQKNLLSLGYTREEVQQALDKAGVAGQRRAETFSLEEWAAVYQCLINRS
ncbi:MAG: 16S rRNA (adenine(1518)-N(6)/adenine(1519)-N(6))-dimethyltransferase RsmA [Chloroflexi bacterium]|nr:16S rRNA (adenine(1518)-N(6)/adenine(1519)-N(6))-dimethyltransferase RsmA [Chloroflexota bacterium]MCI0578522.1 16S rRNA (adenine(1518)-N(6)/adenine(1519)-N(6))-dimethyltransferase RsmA [Chloroflexota bacterium]